METTARIPTSTYRLQFHRGFTFRDATAIVHYLHELGISDVYASPYFQASPDSTHGYDVADHNSLNPAIGDADDYHQFLSLLKERSMGHVLDFVPNHMGIDGSMNMWWWEVLEDGSASPYARYFDIDWRPGKEELRDNVLLPILGDRYGVILEKGELQVAYEDGTFTLNYFDTKLPISTQSYSVLLRLAFKPLDDQHRQKLREAIALFDSLENKTSAKLALKDLVQSDTAFKDAIDSALSEINGTVGDPRSFDQLHELLEAQAYRLSYWKVAAEEINYRRFFDINSLAAIRVEVPEVFEASHQLVFELMSRGDITGLRIDHVDGLWDPLTYLNRLQHRYDQLCGGPNGLYLLVEKILDPVNETLPDDWPVHGTTGYEFANQAVQIFVDESAGKSFTKIYQRFTDMTDSFSDLVYEKKKLILDTSLRSEVSALGLMLDRISEKDRHYRDFTRNALTIAVREVIACFPVYRIYPHADGSLSPADEKVILRAMVAARRRNSAIPKPLFDFVRNVLLLRLSDELSDQDRKTCLKFVRRFQQCSGPVMAKGLEDTAFYIYNRLMALNEVGGHPGDFGMDLDVFHRLAAERQKTHPHSLLATSTHDTKRSEDVRMRLAALSEFTGEWKSALKRWSSLNRKLRTKVEGEMAPSRNEEYLLYQTLLGSWPLGDFDRQQYIERIQQYMLKAIKEAKLNSSWTEPNEEWENSVSSFIASILDPALSAAFLADLDSFASKLAPLGALYSLSQVVLKCTLPGVPDFYQGSELWDFSLVDPDNRRPVDYELRMKTLHDSAQTPLSDLLADWKSGTIKQQLIRRILDFRRSHETFFREADYRPLSIEGTHAQSAIAFERQSPNGTLLIIASRLCRKFPSMPIGTDWQDTRLAATSESEGEWLDVLSGAPIRFSGGNLSEVLGDLPWAVLFRSQS